MQNYEHCGYPTPSVEHDLARGFHAAISSRSFQGTDVELTDTVKDGSVTADSFEGAYASVNNNDFAVFIMHGGHPNYQMPAVCPCVDYPWGPLLGCWRVSGCSSDYAITWNTDADFGYAGWGYLKWVQWYSCATLFRNNAAAYYSDMFQGMHSLMGIRSMMPVPDNTEDAEDLSEYFWNYWKDNSQNLVYSWYNAIAQIIFYREEKAVAPGVAVPAYGFYLETWSSAADTAAPTGGNASAWTEYGTPTYPTTEPYDTTHCE